MLGFGGGADIAEAAATLGRRQRIAKQKLATALRQLPGNRAAVKDSEKLLQELSPWLAGEPDAPVQQGDAEALYQRLNLLGGHLVTLQMQRLFSSLEEVIALPTRTDCRWLLCKVRLGVSLSPGCEPRGLAFCAIGSGSGRRTPPERAAALAADPSQRRCHS